MLKTSESNMSEPTSVIEPSNSETLFEGPFNALLPKFQALSSGEIASINLDIPSAVATALRVAPVVEALRDRVAKECPFFDAEPLQYLRRYALALSHAHALFLMASEPKSSVAPMAAEGMKLRVTLLADSTALVQRDVLDGQPLKKLKGGPGYKNLAFDLQILAEVFRENLADVQGRCATQEADIHRANQIAASILQAVGLREQGPAAIASTAELRARAYTVFTRAYDQVRRVVTFLYWDDDAIDAMAPSLYAGKGGRGKAAPASAQPTLSPSPPTTPVVTPPTSPAFPIHDPPAGNPRRPHGGPFLS
jgi:hypothetical protein